MSEDGAVAVAGRQVVSPCVVVSAERGVVDGRRAVAELDGRADAAHHVAESYQQLDIVVAQDGRRRRREEQVADDVLELATARRRVRVTRWA